MIKAPGMCMEESVIVKLALVIFLCFSSLVMSAQSVKHFDELGKAYKLKNIRAWTDENQGVTLAKASDQRYLGIALPQFGKVYTYDFNKVNSIGEVLGISFGKAATLKQVFDITDQERFRDNTQTLPFGLKIGMTRESVESITGRLLTYPHPTYENIQEAYITNLPGFRFLDVNFWFEADQLVYFQIETNRHGSGAYERRLKEPNHPMKMDVKAAFNEKYRTLIKLSYPSLVKGFKGLLGEYKADEELQTKSVLLTKLKYTFRTDSVMALPEKGYRMVWCTSRHTDKEGFYDELIHNINAMLDSGYRNNTYPDALISAYEQTDMDYFEHYYFDRNDRDNFLTRSSKPVFHVYQVAQSNEVVLEVYEPSGNRAPPAKPFYIGACEPENPDLALSDDQYLEKLAVDIESLKARFAKQQGNSWLKILGGGEWTSTIGFETANGYNEATGKSWLKGIEFKFDKEYSRRVFKGDLPLGFKKGMKLSQIKTIFPGAEYEKRHSKDDWFTTYSGLSISPRIRLSVTMSFRYGKLGRLVVELDEESANSREWKLLKNRVLPQLSN